MSEEHRVTLKIDYVEFGSSDLGATQVFLGEALGWDFIDYGPHYREITQAGLSAGVHDTDTGPPLVILKADNLESARARVKAAGAEVTRDIFDFPGGRRFHFTAPGGVCLAVWSES